MAEKEERIYICFINPEGNDCPVPYGKCNSLCDNCQGGMTRQEAIERMAKAFNTVVTIISPEACLEGAKAALDALLSNDKSYEWPECGQHPKCNNAEGCDTCPINELNKE